MKFYVSKVTSPGTIDIYLVNATWGEATIKYSAAPGIGASIGSFAVTSASQGSYVVVDVTVPVQNWLNAYNRGGIAALVLARGIGAHPIGLDQVEDPSDPNRIFEEGIAPGQQLRDDVFDPR